MQSRKKLGFMVLASDSVELSIFARAAYHQQANALISHIHINTLSATSAVFYNTVLKKITPSCLNYNFFAPKPISIIFGRIIWNNNYNKTGILLPFTTISCKLTTACSMNIQF